jgi:hypothetical protein
VEGEARRSTDGRGSPPHTSPTAPAADGSEGGGSMRLVSSGLLLDEERNDAFAVASTSPGSAAAEPTVDVPEGCKGAEVQQWPPPRVAIWGAAEGLCSLCRFHGSGKARRSKVDGLTSSAHDMAAYRMWRRQEWTKMAVQALQQHYTCEEHKAASSARRKMKSAALAEAEAADAAWAGWAIAQEQEWQATEGKTTLAAVDADAAAAAAAGRWPAALEPKHFGTRIPTPAQRMILSQWRFRANDRHPTPSRPQQPEGSRASGGGGAEGLVCADSAAVEALVRRAPGPQFSLFPSCSLRPVEKACQNIDNIMSCDLLRP